MKKFFKENVIYIFIILIVVLLNYVHLPYYVDTPGGTIDIGDRIELDGGSSVNGSLNMLYVSEYVATIPTYLLSFVIKDWDLEKISDSQIADESANDIYERGRVMLDNSVDNATYVAYTKAGCDISILKYENIVIATLSDNGLEIGDRILEVDGKEIENVNTLKNIILSSNVGDELVVKVLRDDKEKEIEVLVYEQDGNKVIGVVVITNYEFEIDPEISIKFRESESGSSGGLMMALSIYNAISGEDIIKGRNIAGTGTISIDGSVGGIDGVKYKIIGAVDDEMDVVLVPSANYEEAMKVKKDKGYDIEIVSVSTFDDAIEYLRNS